MNSDSDKKIFGIGLSRTGTKSLKVALTQLGYRTAHFREHLQVERGLQSWFEGDFAADDLADFEAALDNPIPIFFRELDQRYSGSRFILTTRDPSSWLESVRRLFDFVTSFDEDLHPYRLVVRERMFGTTEFDSEKLMAVYQRHHADVREYFRNRSSDLLILNLREGEGWSELCSFLGHSVPESEFPWELDQKPCQTGENR